MDLAEMAARYQRGSSLRRIAKDADLHWTTVRYHLRRLGMKLRHSGAPRADPDLIANVRIMRRNGMSFGAIAKMTGNTRSTIAGLVWRHIGNRAA